MTPSGGWGGPVIKWAPASVWVDIDPEVPDMVLNFSDIQQIVNAFMGDPYPYSDPEDCP